MLSTASFILNWFSAFIEIILWTKTKNPALGERLNRKTFHMQSSKSNNRKEGFGRSTSGWL